MNLNLKFETIRKYVLHLQSVYILKGATTKNSNGLRFLSYCFYFKQCIKYIIFSKLAMKNVILSPESIFGVLFSGAAFLLVLSAGCLHGFPIHMFILEQITFCLK